VARAMAIARLAAVADAGAVPRTRRAVCVRVEPCPGQKKTSNECTSDDLVCHLGSMESICFAVDSYGHGVDGKSRSFLDKIERIEHDVRSVC
jgi:hypothetical protein